MKTIGMLGGMSWESTAEILANAAQQVERAGADFLLICTNTMHKVAVQIEQQIDIPLLHIADATAQKLVADNISKVGLLGTKFTMQQDFYKLRLEDAFDIEVMIPNEADQQRVHEIIYQELCLGVINAQSRSCYVTIVEDLFKRGAQAVILGCTEIALLIEQQHTKVPLYDTTSIHAQAAVKAALAD
jgi:aspartate racemase